MKLLLACLIISSSLLGCSSFYYFPLKEELVQREKMPIQPEDVSFESTDGTKLHGWYFKSLTKETKAIIVFFHGNAQNLTTHFYHLYSAPEQGYAYFIFDYRGYGKSEGKPTPKGTVEDGKAAIRWAKKKFPDTPLVVFGQSLGGAISLRTVLEMKDEMRPDWMVVDSTFPSYRSVARDIFSKSWVTWLFQPIAWSIVDNSKAPKDLIDQLAPTPLLVIHGDKDQVVSYWLGEELFKIAPEPKSFWTIPDGIHTDFMFHSKGKYAAQFYEELDHRFANTKTADTKK